MENVETQGLARGPQSVGSQLRAGREALGKSRADIASQTKIAERHLIALEEDRLGDLAARTYAVGFARTYARAIGLDERMIAAKVREQLDHDAGERVEYAPSFEPGDPARVPTRGLAWAAAVGIVVVVGALLLFWSNFLSPEGQLPDLVAEQAAVPAAPKAAPPAVPPPVPAAGPVVLTATGDRVWVKVTDAEGDQVLQKELAKGENWAVPAGVTGLQLRTGRPDALQITVGGKAIPPLSAEPRLVSGVSLAPADLLARGAGSAVPGGAGVSPAAGPAAAISPAPVATRAPAIVPTRRPVPRPAANAAQREPAEVPTPESLLPPTAQ
ncbi:MULTISPECIES: helix-turn-helix domain-containing protein [Novosphingobium]|uniref:helix-turn-helix domain-containing protein n=1 Tax=Novosphingobium TaxID=165696 RepID=UPI0022F26D87|nr:RodZ domain-containing protein [Novosphingobium resinovorum]